MKHPDFGRREAVKNLGDSETMVGVRVSDAEEPKLGQLRVSRFQKRDDGMRSGRGETVDHPDPAVRQFQDDRLAVARSENMNAEAGSHTQRPEGDLLTIAGENRPVAAVLGTPSLHFCMEGFQTSHVHGRRFFRFRHVRIDVGQLHPSRMAHVPVEP